VVGVVVALGVVAAGCASTARGDAATAAGAVTSSTAAGATTGPTRAGPSTAATPAPTTVPPTAVSSATTPGTTAAPTVGAPGIAPATCPRWSAPTVTGQGGLPLVEVSGLAAGHRNPNLLWTHNDSGDTARVFAINQAGAVVTEVTVGGAGALDWEDIAIGPGPDDQPWIWVADAGDNLHFRPNATIYRFPEPALGATPPAQLTVEAQRTDVSYPDGPTNVESLMVDPMTGDGFLVGKDVAADQTVAVYRLPHDELRDGGHITAPVVARVIGRTDQRNGPTAADISADGTLVLVSNGRQGFVWRRDPATPVGTVLAASPTAPCAARVGGGEAVTFSLDGQHLWAMDEGAGAELRRYDRTGT
jgi:hypothetical protein